MPVMPQDRLALDRASARTIDADGHLHVAASNISKAQVSGYLGREIPDCENLGLQPDRLYQLLRDPAELEKAAASFNGKPLLITHKPQTAAEHDHELTVGAVSNVAWQAPFLTAELAVWDAAAIAGITSGEQRELSSAYRYKADMTPGSYEGVRYDGVMRDIVANHVALVESGRAGSDVVVGDAALQPPHSGRLTPAEAECAVKEQFIMAKTAALSRTALFASGALRTYLRPKLAQDARVDLAKLMAGVTGKTFGARRPKLKLALDAAVKGKLAADASLSDVDDLLDELQEAINDVADDPDPVVDPVDDEAETEEEKAARMAKRAADKEARDADPDKDADKDDDKDADKDKPPMDKPGMTKAAMDKPAMDAVIATVTAAVRAQTVAHMNAIRAAEDAVRPHIGTLAVAMDSADDVYQLALDHLKAQGHPVDLIGVPRSAYGPLFRALAPMAQAAAARPQLRIGQGGIAQDAAQSRDFSTRFPAVAALRVI